MSEPKRYTISGLHPHIIESKDGFMVYYDDYARLKAEVERLTAFTTRTIIPNEQLQAEVERLTKAGDAMHTNIPKMVTSRITSDEVIGLYNDWIDAKEGKDAQ